MEAVAKLNNCPIAPRKMMLVADAVRGVQVIDALNTLRYAQKAGAPLVEKLILSAVANWENKNPDESVEDADLYVKSIFVTGGRQLKRFRPAPQGRAHRIRKRSNHVTVVVDARSTSLIDVVSEGSSESNESDN
ncbi:50S ribosomal protein L22 [Flammeovirga kamogawensis]|uniref:Large ribosomal subunit protein uL22 n=1 Tax=Flammeovirga kamogawensis TaxID=373891 RepID=A0ABX8GSU9_9BACT|nr:50S ribosomal protein L22 [Flammeovirga kamogawensis]QWG06631.1 50S ribosomal protein L22 [Flammeovirga kamogawensis]TRX68454.1 50S ribosomal protein L22 [Flammeovirga kamogawensis]